MNFMIEHEREEDGRWLAEVPEMPDALAYGARALRCHPAVLVFPGWEDHLESAA